MNKIIGEHGSGKTSRLMLLAKETGATIVCSNPDAFAYKAKAYGLEGIKFMSYDKYFCHLCENKVLIDELDELLHEMDPNIIGYCVTQDD